MKRWMRIIVIIAIVILAVVLIKTYFSEPATIMAQTGVMEDLLEADGILVFHESVVNSAAVGTLETYYPDGERVAKGTKIATVHTGDIDPEMQKKLNAVNNRIQELESRQSRVLIFSEDATKLESMISERSREIIAATASGNLAEVQALKNDINLLLDKKNSLGGNSKASAATLDKLYQEKARYESQLNGAITDLYAPIAGIFSTKMDGYENLLTVSGIPSMTVTDLETVLKPNPSEEENAQGLCKIMDGYKWYFLTVMDEEMASGFQKGQLVSLRSAVTSDALVNASVYFVGEAQEGECVVAIACTHDISISLTSRKMGFQVVKKRYEGLKLPVRALRIVDGAEGVYVLKETGKIFKKVDVLYKGPEQMIVRENNTDSSMLTLYDQVVISQ